ncbi:hypothetical protein V4Y02_23540, partial [Escherichia coli]
IVGVHMDNKGIGERVRTRAHTHTHTHSPAAAMEEIPNPGQGRALLIPEKANKNLLIQADFMYIQH